MKMHKKWRNLVVLGMLLAVLSPDVVDARTKSVAPVEWKEAAAADVGGLPVPPRQGDPWTSPDADLPPVYLSAAAALFEQGMADPRGCDYRKITFVVGNVRRGAGEVVTTRGWVLPDKGEQRFAVAWNGLVYPVLAVGEPGDLRADVLAAIRESEGRVWRTWNAYPERETVVPDTRFAIQGSLLLRLGEADLAREVWSAIEASKRARFKGLADGSEEEVEPIKLPDADPYLDWASEWAWGLFERAVVAHMRGEDGMALASARILAAVSPSIEAEARRRGYRVSEYNSSPSLRPGYLPFLGPLPALLADQERRREREEPLFSLDRIAEIEKQDRRIEALIDRLEEIALRQMGQPGGLGPIRWDASAAAILKEGEAAIGPLIECLESDECAARLTRSVSFSRDFHRDRRLHPVGDMTAQLLLQLMEVRSEEIGLGFHGVDPRHLSNREVAARFREYWEEFGHLSLPERWYRTLADEGAGMHAWMSVLHKMMRPQRVDGGRDETRMAGDPLRAKTSPSVTELLVRNAESLVEAAGDRRARTEAARFILEAAKWEAAPLLPVAAELQKQITARLRPDWDGNLRQDSEARYVGSLAVLRADHGDDEALREYAKWIEAFEPVQVRAREILVDVLEPFWRVPEHRLLRDVRHRFFEEAADSWTEVLSIAQAHHGSHSLAASPLLLVPEFRGIVVRQLDKCTPVGNAIYHGEGRTEIDYGERGGRRFGGSRYAEDVKPGTAVTLRNCDETALQLARIPGFPEFRLFRSESARDETIAAMAELLRASPERLRLRERPGTLSGPVVELAPPEKAGYPDVDSVRRLVVDWMVESSLGCGKAQDIRENRVARRIRAGQPARLPPNRTATGLLAHIGQQNHSALPDHPAS